MLRFLHAADLHLDAPFSGLAAYDGAPVDRLREATRRAFERLIDLALAEQVDFVVIAGDLFDGDWSSLQTGLWAASQFRRLGKIPVFLIRGNHDAQKILAQRIAWPENVREFSVEQPETMLLPGLDVALHGRGFATREARTDLAAGYPSAVPGCWNIGLLHTSLNGDDQHDSYAPTTEAVLLDKGYNYWALGHIHQFRVVREYPHVIYPGCTQGRHIHESGAKGCVLVTASGGKTTLDFRPLDSLRWQLCNVSVADCESPEDVLDVLAAELETAVSAAEGRDLAVRIRLEGLTRCHAQLHAIGASEILLGQVQNLGNELGRVWVEQLQIDTLPAISTAKLLERNDLLGELMREFHTLQQAADLETEAFMEVLQPLVSKARREFGESKLDPQSPAQLRNWLAQAERLLLSRFLEQGLDTDR